MSDKEEESKAPLLSSSGVHNDSSDEGSRDEPRKSANGDVGLPYGESPEEKEPLKKDAQGFQKLRAFPFSVLFIVGNEFCERFSYYGMRAVLVLFLNQQLAFTEDSATAIYHAFIMLCYLLPILGAIISDSCLGKYVTILTLSVVYSCGNFLVSISAIPFLREVNIALAAVGLVIIALGTGGIKPCVSAFGGDQFRDDQKGLLRRFFSLFYFSINAGSVISTLLTPVLRNYINCFGTCQCFALAFGVPAVLMLVSILIFLAGTKFYIIKKPKKEAALLYVNVPLCIMTAIFRRAKHGKLPDKKNILQYASPKFSDSFIDDVWLLLRVVVMLLPLPVFWALFDQQGSRWTLQAVRMNGQLGQLQIQPDQMQALNPILILVFIPIFEIVIYPLFAKCHLFKKPLQRMVVGMFLAGLAFMVAGFVQLTVQDSETHLTSGQAKGVFTNTLPLPLQLQLQQNGSSIFNTSLSYGESDEYRTDTLDNYMYTLMVTGDGIERQVEFALDDENITHIVISSYNDGSLAFTQSEYQDFSPSGGNSTIQVINAVNESYGSFNFSLVPEGGEDTSECSTASFGASYVGFLDATDQSNITVGKYNYQIITVPDNMVGSGERSGGGSGQEPYSQSGELDITLEGGAVYTVVVTQASVNSTNGDIYRVMVVEIDPPNSVSLFLQIPMYFLITAGEVMFSITGLEFAYSQAPVSMKAMCQAAWLLTVAFGNLVVIIVAESSIFADRAIEFFFFAILIAAVAVVFAVMSYFYKYVDLSERGQSADDPTNLPKDESSALIMGKQNAEEDSKPGYPDPGTVGVYHSESEF